MRALTVMFIALAIAACSATQSQHPGEIGGEQAVKSSSLSAN